jgi:hypothetical protein
VAAEVAAATGLDVLGWLPFDPGSLNTLLANGLFRGWTKSPLGRAANMVLLELAKRRASSEAAVVGS